MPRLKARIHNERVKSFCGIVNALASAVLVLSFIRPKLDEEQHSVYSSGVELSDKFASFIEAGASVEPGVNVWWVAGAGGTYVIAFMALGLLRHES